MVCFAGPRFKSATSGFTKKLFCLLQFDLVRKIALLLGCEQSLPAKSRNRSSDLPLSFAPRLFCLRPVPRSAHVRRKNSEKRFRWVYIPAVKPPTCRLSDSRVYCCANAADLHRFAESRPVPLSICSPPQNQPFRFRVSRSCAIAARSRRPVTGCNRLPVLPAEQYSRSDFGLTQLFANKSAPRQTVTGKAEPHGLTAAKKNARKRSFSPKPAVTITVMQVFDCGAIPVRQPTVHVAQP